jgi:hypothetical protein
MNEKLIPLEFQILKSKEHLKYFAQEMWTYADENLLDVKSLIEQNGLTKSQFTVDKHSYFIKADASILLGDGGLAPYTKHVIYDGEKIQLSFVKSLTFHGKDTPDCNAYQLSAKIVNENGTLQKTYIPFPIKKTLAWAFFPVGTKILVCDETPASMFLALHLVPKEVK